ncbi:MAG: Crp/Fnr family transcriptional regulator [Spongiibacteraceae bacterium]|nr:Crp/Fnr family transcriptional regulator [Spongiibacteraceae bacterium]
MDSYSLLSGSTWQALKKICTFSSLEKKSVLYPCSQIPRSFAFVYSGLFRIYVCDERGREYNKRFFDEGTFPGAMSALLTSSASEFTIESLEPSLIICIDFLAFRKLLMQLSDLQLFHIFYLEKNWLLEKDAREVALVQDDATSRYLRFLEEYPRLSSRVSQYHIASHLGITPTQLSRIRKKFDLST